jgi:hypothetical protein
VQRKIVQKSHSMPFSGILIQLTYATLAMICRISACVMFFAPAIGLFNLLGHWKMGNLKFASGEKETVLIYDVTDNGTFIYANDVFKKIKNPEGLTVFQLDVYYIVFLFIIMFHFFLVAAIKFKCSKEFKSRKDYLKKILHILHQGDHFAFLFGKSSLFITFDTTRLLHYCSINNLHSFFKQLQFHQLTRTGMMMTLQVN